jgi:nuclease S1
MGHSKARRKRTRSIFVGALTLLVCFQMTASAWAWGRIGHRVIAKFAEKKLNPKAKAAIAALLDEGESIADASTWADENRGRLPKTAPWHYVDVPLDQAKYDSRFSGDVPDKGCIVDKIHEFQKTLKDPSRSVEERRFALRFLVHLIQDLHMPLHVGDNHDKGASRTQVRFYDRGTNMHRLWDSYMIERAGDDEDFWLADLAELDKTGNRDAAMKGTVEDWATESLLAARAAYRVPEIGKWLKPGEKLGDTSQEVNLPVMRLRLYQAGVRVALVLNEAFPEK